MQLMKNLKRWWAYEQKERWIHNMNGGWAYIVQQHEWEQEMNGG